MTRRLALVAGLALAITASLATPSFAQTGGLAAQSARINVLRSAGKYSEALPLAQAMVVSLEKTSKQPRSRRCTQQPRADLCRSGA